MYNILKDPSNYDQRKQLIFYKSLKALDRGDSHFKVVMDVLAENAKEIHGKLATVEDEKQFRKLQGAIQVLEDIFKMIAVAPDTSINIEKLLKRNE